MRCRVVWGVVLLLGCKETDEERYRFMIEDRNTGLRAKVAACESLRSPPARCAAISEQLLNETLVVLRRDGVRTRDAERATRPTGLRDDPDCWEGIRFGHRFARGTGVYRELLELCCPMRYDPAVDPLCPIDRPDGGR